jgi:hypothetical protein
LDDVTLFQIHRCDTFWFCTFSDAFLLVIPHRGNSMC